MDFGLFSLPNWALIRLVSGPSLLGLMSSAVMSCSLCTFDTFLALSRYVILQLMNHQNSWNFVSYELYF